MECAEVRPLLDLLHDGVLEAKDTALVLDHLRGCEACDGEWKGLEELKSRFQTAREKPELPSDLMARIAGNLRAEEKKQRKVVAFPALIAAASVLLVGLFAVSSLDLWPKAPAHAEELVAGLGDGTVEAVQDKQLLATRLGFGLKQLNLVDWRMASSGVSKLAKDAHLARFDFINDATGEKLSCYQGRKGTIAAAGVREKLADKEVLLGERGKYRYALWSQNDRDYLFVTQLPVDKLRALVAGV